jgi:DNA-binding response OmpR family regulator
MLAGTVLVADDDADIVRFVEVNLRLEGFQVVTARDGQEALTKALDLQPDVVLLDVVMPRIDGYTVCERLRADDRGMGIPVILLTANFITADQEVARQAGADDLVVKPFDPCKLMTRVKELARTRR